MTTGDIVLLIAQVVIGGVLVWLVASLKIIWAAQKDLMQQRIELLRAQIPAAQELAAKVKIIKEAAETEKRELEQQLSDRDEAHEEHLREKHAQITELQEQIQKYEEAGERQETAAIEARRYARNILAHGWLGQTSKERKEQCHRLATEATIRHALEAPVNESVESRASRHKSN